MPQTTSYQNKEWANELLRYSIRVLQGKEFKAHPKTLMLTAINNKDTLDEAGYWWQAKTLKHWLNRFKRGDFTARRADPPAGGPFTITPARALG